MMWVEKHRPANPAQMVGNEDSRLGVLKWLAEWTPKSKPALLLGPPGTGKTTLVHAAASILGYTVLEFNASDRRTKDRLEAALSPVTNTVSLLAEKRLIFLDEVDGLYGRQDYGGLDFVLDLVKSGAVPVVMAANYEDDDKVRKLAEKSAVYRFKPVPPRLLEVYLRSILLRERASLSDEALQDISQRSRGDVRGAVNDLQMAVELPQAPMGPTGGRDQIFASKDAVDSLSRSEKPAEAIAVLHRWDAQPQEKLRTLYASVLGSRLEGESLRRALEVLAKADGLLGEIKRTQTWRLLRYFDQMLASGLIDAVPRGHLSYHADDLPWSLKLRIWNEGRVFRTLRDTISRRFRVTRGEAVALLLPYFAVILGAEKEGPERFARLLRLEEPAAKVLAKEVSRAKTQGGTG